MWTRQYRNRRRVRLIMPALTALFLAYFGFHVVNGSFGLRANETFEAEKARLESTLIAERGEREALERRIALLRDGSIERDMLDEQVRRSLNYVGPNDLVILR